MAGRFGLVSEIPEYPGFLRTSPHFQGDEEIWEGVIRPFAGCSEPDLLLILDDLHAGNTVCIRHGTLSHDPNCVSQHTSIDVVTAITVTKRMGGFDAAAFTIRVVVPAAPRHPKAVALYPEISADAYPRHPHLFRQDRRPGWPRFTGADALCTYRPGSKEGDLATASMTTFLDFVAVFLAKHMVWTRTRGPEGIGWWLGPDASHAPAVLLKAIESHAECHCGSGKPYGDCHRGRDLARAPQVGARPAA